MHSDVSSGGYQYNQESSIMTDATVTFAETNAVTPCVEIVSAGTDSQGASVQARTDNQNVDLNVFELDAPILDDVDEGIDVTIRATGQ